MKVYSLILYICIFGLLNSYHIYDLQLLEEFMFEEVDDCSGFFFRVKVIDITNKSIQLKVFNDQNPNFRVFVKDFNGFPSDDMIYDSWEYTELSSSYSKTSDSLFYIYNYPFSIADNTEYLVFYVETPIYLNFLSILVNPEKSAPLNIEDISYK